MKKLSPSQAQLKIEFKEIKKEEPKEIKVISLQKIQNNELNAKILNRQRPNY